MDILVEKPAIFLGNVSVVVLGLTKFKNATKYIIKKIINAKKAREKAVGDAALATFKFLETEF